MNQTKINLAVGGLLLFNLLVAAWLPLHQDIYFHTDIARDFLLIEEVLTTHKLTLIGPRTSIQGLFHGPLWLYLNMPIFWLSSGNPVAAGWFWVGLFCLSMMLMYFIAKKLFRNHNDALLAVLLYSTLMAPTIPNSFNPFGATVLSPLWFWLVWLYLQHGKAKHLALSYLALGLIAQFQIAFAVPMMLIQSILVVYLAAKNKRWIHIATLAFFFIPLTTHFLFDYRHQFIQAKAIISFLHGSDNVEGYNLIKILTQRFKGLMFDGYGILPKPYAYLVPWIMAYGLYLWKRNKKKASKNYVLVLFLYFYLGFWLITILYKGVVWGFYFSAIMPLTLIALVSLKSLFNKKLFFLLVGLVFGVNFVGNLKWLQTANTMSKTDPGSWKFQYNVAKSVFGQSPGEFGYFVYTPDQYGYSPRYAMLYTQKQFPKIKAIPYEKKPYTVIIKAPDTGDNPYTSVGYFVKEKVKIQSQPVLVNELANGYQVASYRLTQPEIDSGVDSTIVSGMFFR